MSYWDRPDAQQAIRDRAIDRAFMQDDWEPQPADDDVHAGVDPYDSTLLATTGATGVRLTDPPTFEFGDDPDVHETCGYVWEVHDTKLLPPDGVATPFGCPWSEQEAIERWGPR